MTLRGFELKVIGVAPRAARFAGFSERRNILLAFAISGALAGLAGIIEVAGPIGQLLPTISPGYGFSAIIVAFLGRLNPIGIFLAGLFLALSYLGGEAAQIALRVPLDLTNVLQGVLLFYVLACDTFILYRLRVEASRLGAPCCLKRSFSPSSLLRRRCFWRRSANWWWNAPACSISASRA